MQNMFVSGYCSEIAQLAERHSGNEKVSSWITGADNIFACWFM